MADDLMSGVVYYRTVASLPARTVASPPRPAASRAYAAPTPRTAARPTAARPAFDYEFVPTRDVDAAYRAACRQTLRQACRLRQSAVGPVKLAFFRVGSSDRERYEFSSPRNLAGRSVPATGTLWVSSELPSLREAITSVAHEVEHFHDLGGTEEAAVVFGAAFWRAHGPQIEGWARSWGRWDTRS